MHLNCIYNLFGLFLRLIPLLFIVFPAALCFFPAVSGTRIPEDCCARRSGEPRGPPDKVDRGPWDFKSCGVPEGLAYAHLLSFPLGGASRGPWAWWLIGCPKPLNPKSWTSPCNAYTLDNGFPSGAFSPGF